MSLVMEVSIPWINPKYLSKIFIKLYILYYIVITTGAGTILDTLRCKLPLIVVVNTDLMDNHQIELTSAMESGNYLFSSDVKNLLQILKAADLSSLTLYPEADKFAFPTLVDEVMGIHQQKKKN